MNYLDRKYKIDVLKNLIEKDEFCFWIDPKNIYGFKKQGLEFSEKNYIENHYLLLNHDEEPEVLITTYLTGCLRKDHYDNNKNISVEDFISAALYLLTELYSTHTAYPLAWGGYYLINNNSLDLVLGEIYIDFHKNSHDHVKNLLRVFCIELLDVFEGKFERQNQQKYEEIKAFKTDNTYMY